MERLTFAIHRLLCSYVYVMDHSLYGAERMALDGGWSEQGVK